MDGFALFCVNYFIFDFTLLYFEQRFMFLLNTVSLRIDRNCVRGNSNMAFRYVSKQVKIGDFITELKISNQVVPKIDNWCLALVLVCSLLHGRGYLKERFPGRLHFLILPLEDYVIDSQKPPRNNTSFSVNTTTEVFFFYSIGFWHLQIQLPTYNLLEISF